MEREAVPSPDRQEICCLPHAIDSVPHKISPSPPGGCNRTPRATAREGKLPRPALTLHRRVNLQGDPPPPPSFPILELLEVQRLALCDGRTGPPHRLRIRAFGKGVKGLNKDKTFLEPETGAWEMIRH
ncbi:hypothetical protein SKAU_G00125350 [Synaphobranchus kaupii]|uniref:Uncharacterized protein n=1 Tax=Synaphobranchus kaupii TaxID=118154 RepID=A0A9Q1FPR1_SYNKA|nr:hypothetical protein SKAU_G00125350 [Synaphobranchus kaupii]